MIKRIVSSLLILIAGLVLVADVLIFSKFNINFKNNFGYSNTPNFIYAISQSIAVVIILITIILKLRPYKVVYLIPFYIEILQIQWVFSDTYSEKSYFNIYVFGLTLIMAFIIVVINSLIKDEINKDAKISYLEAVLDLQLSLISNKNNID